VLKKYSFILVLLVFLILKINLNSEIEIKISNQEELKIQYNKIKEQSSFARIIVPKINLDNKLFDKNSSLNNVDKNIQIIRESNMPDVKNGNFILAAHSGNSNVSYFKSINRLLKNDSVFIEYKNIKYEYRVKNSYVVKKTGEVHIVRNNNINTLTLITCIENTNNQLIIICELYKSSKL